MCYLAVFVVFVFITLYKVSCHERDQEVGCGGCLCCDVRLRVLAAGVPQVSGCRSALEP
jgi:7-cyano-7-deazaguanine synthase in queuosine biosynthesis